MSADQAINQWLLQDPVLVGLVTNFAIGRVPSNAQFPLLQLQQVGGTAIPDMQNGRNPGLSNYTYQIDVYASERSAGYWLACPHRPAQSGDRPTAPRRIRRSGMCSSIAPGSARFACRG